MENASKALIIAGGILLGMIILGLLVFTWHAVRNLNLTADDLKKQDEISAFNKQFESYSRYVVRGADVASIINKITDNNNTYGEDEQLVIHCSFH